MLPYVLRSIWLVDQITRGGLGSVAARQSNTREQIIRGAYTVLAEQGFEAASIKEIAREAGVTPGLVHYHFTNKDELLLAVLREASAAYTRQMAQLGDSCPPAQLAGAALGEPRERVARQPEWYRLRYELFALGLRNPAIAPGLANLLDDGRSGIRNILLKLSPDQPDAHLAASILLACFDGLALQKLADPSFDLNGAYELLDRMASALLDAP